MKPISLVFEFANEQGVKQPIFFTQPIKIIVAEQEEDVLTKLADVQAAVDAGYYAAGYVSYEAAPAFDKNFTVKSEPNMPLVWFGIFEKTLPVPEENEGFFQLSDWTTEMPKERYEAGFNKIQAEIKQGNTYQVNYTMRLQAQCSGDDYAFYRQLTRTQQANYSAYLNTGKFRILSASPELFFHWKDGVLTTRPMKGTVKRGIHLVEDLAQANWLATSAKNQAENVMIVDLLRNDVSVVAETGSVHVPNLFQIEQYPTVWQMTSTVQAKTKQQTTIIDLFKALFPCGSITGAPKMKTMDIITNVEEAAREVYCGTIGYFTPDHEAVFNVPIRTVWLDSETGQAEYGVGGGITWDSTVTEEYEEALLKAKLLTEVRPDFDLLESLRLENGVYYLLDHHLERVRQAADYFQYALSEAEVRKQLVQFAQEYPSGVYKVRLIVAKIGVLEIVGQPIIDIDQPVIMTLANTPIATDQPFVYFKTTNRAIYETFQQQATGYFDVLLWNERGEITEFTNGNVVVKLDGTLYTPPVECGLLAGTFRKELLHTNEIVEKVITKAELLQAEEVWFINSVRKWVKVVIV